MTAKAKNPNAGMSAQLKRHLGVKDTKTETKAPVEIPFPEKRTRTRKAKVVESAPVTKPELSPDALEVLIENGHQLTADQPTDEADKLEVETKIAIRKLEVETKIAMLQSDIDACNQIVSEKRVEMKEWLIELKTINKGGPAGPKTPRGVPKGTHENTSSRRGRVREFLKGLQGKIVKAEDIVKAVGEPKEKVVMAIQMMRRDGYPIGASAAGYSWLTK